MKPSRDLDPQLLRSLLEYNHKTGKLIWLERPAEMFSCDRVAKGWNAKLAGKEAIVATNSNGYLCGAVTSVFSFGHRVAWAIYYGETPDGFIDHINGDKTDNRIANLRVVSKTGNCRNISLRPDSASGVFGVRKTPSGKWSARIGVGGKPLLLGTFDKLEDAIAVRKQAERNYAYHPNHGRERKASTV